MLAREKILGAFSPEGTTEPGAVVCYDSLLIRDHWPALTRVPWWYAFSGVPGKDVAWARDVWLKTGIEWLHVRPCPSRAADFSSSKKVLAR